MVELLSPVGNKKALYYAVINGADAVYFAGKRFGARAFALNFSDDEIIEAIEFCHLYGVKVYVTVNTIIYQDEVKEVIDYVKFLYLNNVDALIMQDLGMIKRVKKMFPNLEIHASTQCHIHNKETALALADLGVSRVVFARELDLNTIKNMDIEVEKEIFIHGALCVCYSGCCLFSSLNGGRSANRGECVGNCRLSYKLIENDRVVSTKGEFLLSMRELNTIKNIDKILDSDIKCLKIEGRMKGYEYVGYITRMYRKAIDNYYKNKIVNISDEEINNMNVLYNRMTTNGYLFNDKVSNIINSNHIGVYLGNVIDVNKKRIRIKLNDNLYQGDGIRFKNNNFGMIVNKLYDSRGLLVSKACKNDIVEVDNKVGLLDKDVVHKTSDVMITKSVDDSEIRRVGIDIKVIAKIGYPLEIKFSDGNNIVSKKIDKVDKAFNKEVTELDIKDKLSKLGNSIYQVNNFNIVKDDNIFISLSVLNNARRKLVEELNKKRISNNYEIVINEFKDKVFHNKKVDDICINVLVSNEEQLVFCLNNNMVNDIYVSDYGLYLKYKDNLNVYYQVPRVNNKLDNYEEERLLATELSSVVKYSKNNCVVSDYYLNVVNNDIINYLNNLGVKRITLSLELSDDRLKLLNHNNTEIVIYGRACLMITRYCVLKECLNNCNKCKNNNNRYYLEDRFKHRYPIIHNDCITSIMDCKVIDKIISLDFYKNIGIKYYRIELFDESVEEVEDIISRFKI